MYETFIFERYEFDADNATAKFYYSFDGQQQFCEKIEFSRTEDYDENVLDRALRLAFIVAGVSYYKAFYAPTFLIKPFDLSPAQADFFNAVYYHGLSQFVFENQLDPKKMAKFSGTDKNSPLEYGGDGTLVLQSGGKDSLLLAELLRQKNRGFTPWFVQQSNGVHPMVLDELSAPLRKVTRTIDLTGLAEVKQDGALNGHVPVTQIILSYALVDAILHGENTMLAAIGREGEEPHADLGNYPVMHQWAKTWQAEQMLAEYMRSEISPDIKIGSPLRGFSELKIAELFVQNAWKKFGKKFSSCNVANYEQGHNNRELSWCGNCPKCANSFLLFAPFVSKPELEAIFHGDLFQKPELEDTFKGLLGIDDVMKPFECIGEISELRHAYHQALKNGFVPLPFAVPPSSFEIDTISDHQTWAAKMIQ